MHNVPTQQRPKQQPIPHGSIDRKGGLGEGVVKIRLNFSRPVKMQHLRVNRSGKPYSSDLQGRHGSETARHYHQQPGGQNSEPPKRQSLGAKPNNKELENRHDLHGAQLAMAATHALSRFPRSGSHALPSFSPCGRNGTQLSSEPVVGG